MTRRDIAAWMCAFVSGKRLERSGLTPPEHAVGFDQMTPEDRQPWLDCADALLVFNNSQHPVERLNDLGRDWIRYTMQIADPPWRDEMRRAVVIEMQVEVARLAAECGLSPGDLVAFAKPGDHRRVRPERGREE